MPRFVLRACAASIVLLAGPAFPARATPLQKQECESLQAEQSVLTAAGVRELMERGADWGKDNLTPDQLKRVERYIVLEEQMSFRCGLAKLRATLPNADEGGEQDIDQKGELATPKGAKKMPPLPKRKPAIRATTTQGDAPLARARKRRSGPKLDDAYRPPRPAQPGVDPFAASVPAKSTKP